MSRNTTAMATPVSDCDAPMDGDIAAMALPPQTAVPVLRRMDRSLSTPKSLPRAIPIIRVNDIDIIVIHTEVRPTLMTASRCIPKPRSITAAWRSFLETFPVPSAAGFPAKSAATAPRSRPHAGFGVRIESSAAAASHILRFDVMFFKLFSNTGPPIMHGRSIIRVYYNPTSGMFGLFSCFIIFCWYFKNVNKHNFIAINVDHP